MKRQDKYPETETFHFHNANPFGKYTTDCVIRAISTATGLDYKMVVLALAVQQMETGLDPSEPKSFNAFLTSQGWTKNKQPRKANGKKYTGVEFCEFLQRYLDNADIHGAMYDNGIEISKNIIANIGGNHTVAIIDGKVFDTWDSTDGCIGNYWTKGGE